MTTTLNRRNFLALGSLTTSTVFLAQCSRRLPLISPVKTSQDSSKSAVIALTEASWPKTYHSKDGFLSLDLIAQPQSIQLGDRTAQLLTYNGQVPGPRLEAKPGDTVQIKFTNQLNQPTNLHYHGLHIPPTGTGDDVFLKITPGENHTYEFQIPTDHPAGTFWYHPHYHGLVAEQLFGGLAGLFIVRGELDEIPEIKAAQEEFLVLKDFTLTGNGTIPAPGHMAQMTGRIGDLLTANGQFNPDLSISQGGLLRLRLLNASSSRFFQLAMEGHSFHLIATDGGAIATPIELSTLVLAPGERAEVLVQGNQNPGQYRLLNYPFNPAQGMNRSMMGGMGHGIGRMGHGMMGQPQQNRSETVATLTYQNTTQIPTEALLLPSQLIPVEPLPEPQTIREFSLNHGMGMGMVFLINGQAFDGDRIDTTVALNTVEDWAIINTGTMAHPFHIHVNKFQVISRNDHPEPYIAWKDVVSVSPGERVRIRMAFQDYIGKTVYHCHVLDHEDRGMMGILDIKTS